MVAVTSGLGQMASMMEGLALVLIVRWELPLLFAAHSFFHL
jgi:hypothetical protein